MSDLNSINVTARLGAEPELRHSNGGEAILNLRLAVSNRVKKGAEWVDETIWLNTALFGKRAEGFAKIARKGMRVGVSGSLRVREYEGNNGKGTSVEIFAESVVPLDSKRDDSPASAGNGGKPRNSKPQDDEPDFGGGGGASDFDDIPFAPVGDVG